MDLTDLRQGADTLIDGTPCYSIAARCPKVTTVELEFLIETTALLVRQIITTRERGKFLAREVRESIHINEPIDDTLFKHAA